MTGFLTPKVRRNLLVVISGVCLTGGAAALYGAASAEDGFGVQSARIGLLLGMMLLPGATFAARRLERRVRRAC